jgi:hypothetical protein
VKSKLAVLLMSALAAVPCARAVAEDVTETRSGVKFAASQNGHSLLGTALRTKTFLKVKVYALGLYVSDAALQPGGALAAHKGKGRSAAAYKDLVWGDFPKEIVLKFVRDVSASQVQEAFRESLGGVDKAKVDAFVGLFGDTKVGQEYVLRWLPGGALEVVVLGQAKPPIADKNLAAAVFGIWLGDKAIQDDIKKDLVSRL